MNHYGISFALNENDLLTIEDFPDNRALVVFRYFEESKDKSLYRDVKSGLLDNPHEGRTFEEIKPKRVNLIRFLPNKVGEVKRIPPLHVVEKTWPPHEKDLVTFEAADEE